MKMKHKIYVTDYKRRKLEFSEELVGQDVELQLLQEKDETKLFPRIEDADALIIDRIKMTAQSIQKLNKCKIIMRMGIGYDNIDLKAAGDRGIYVCNIPDYCIEEVADHTIGLLLGLSRSIVPYNNSLLVGDVKNWNPLLGNNTRLKGLVFGLVGWGFIGKAVATRAQSLGMKVCFYDPYVTTGFENLGVEKVDDLHTLAGISDVISFHVPLTDETRHLANEEFFSSLKKGAMLINVSRGPVVKTSALHDALKNNIVSKAALDVIEKEPINFEEELFCQWLKDKSLQQRLIITPHAAFHSFHSEKEIKTKSIENIKLVFGGKEPKNCVNLKYLRVR